MERREGGEWGEQEDRKKKEEEEVKQWRIGTRREEKEGAKGEKKNEEKNVFIESIEVQ